jgi:hypothetical protein
MTTNPPVPPVDEGRSLREPECFDYLRSRLIGKPHVTERDNGELMLFTLADAREVIAHHDAQSAALAGVREATERLQAICALSSNPLVHQLVREVATLFPRSPETNDAEA